MKVSILIVTYNGLEYTRRCLASVREEVLSHSDYEVILHDNASREPVADMVRTEFPWVKVIEGENGGFAYGNNRALEQASDPEYALLLNPDVFVSPGVIEATENLLDSNSTVGAVTVMNEGMNGEKQHFICQSPSPL